MISPWLSQNSLAIGESYQHACCHVAQNDLQKCGPPSGLNYEDDSSWVLSLTSKIFYWPSGPSREIILALRSKVILIGFQGAAVTSIILSFRDKCPRRSSRFPRWQSRDTETPLCSIKQRKRDLVLHFCWANERLTSAKVTEKRAQK